MFHSKGSQEFAHKVKYLYLSVFVPYQCLSNRTPRLQQHSVNGVYYSKLWLSAVQARNNNCIVHLVCSKLQYLISKFPTRGSFILLQICSRRVNSSVYRASVIKCHIVIEFIYQAVYSYIICVVTTVLLSGSRNRTDEANHPAHVPSPQNLYLHTCQGLTQI